MTKKPPKYPPKLKLKRLREARGLSMAALARLINREAPVIYKLEHGLIRYNETLLGALSAALGVSQAELLDEERAGRAEAPAPETGAPPAPGFAEDATPYDPAPGALPPLRDKEFAYKIQSNVLDQIGIIAGDIGIFSFDEAKIQAVRTGQVVLAQRYDPNNPFKAVTLLRQFLAPSMLVTNSARENQPQINLRLEDARIAAVIVSSHRISE